MIRFASPCTIQAGKVPSFEAIAYNGGILKLKGFDRPIVVDLATMEKPRQDIPLLREHDPARPIGHLNRVQVTATSIIVAGAISGVSEEANIAIEMSKRGYSWQASIGAHPGTLEPIDAGKRVRVNGRDFDGPIYVSRGSTLRELSLVTLGADASTEVRIAASLKGAAMDFESWVTSLGLDVSTLSDTAKAELQKAFDAMKNMDPTPPPVADIPASAFEAHRIAAIETATHNMGIAGMSDLRATAIATGLSPEVVQARALSLIRGSRPSGPHLHVARSAGSWMDSKRHVEAGILVRAGYGKLAEKVFGADIVAQSRPLHAATLMEIAAASLRVAGREVPQSKDEMIRAAFSTGSLPTALGSSADKVLYDAYTTAPASWRSFAEIKTAANFKTQTGVRGTFFGDLEEVGDGGEVAHGNYGEETYTYSVGQFAKQLVIGRKAIINDDLGLIDTFAPAMGRAAARTLNDKVLTTMLSGHSTFWTTARLNYFEGAATNLQASSLATAIKTLRQMKDAEGSLLDLEPAVLLVPPELEQTARGLIESAEVSRDTSVDNLPTGNTHKSVATLVVEPRLSDSDFTGYSTTAWWLFSAPNNGAVVVAFLNGVQNPTSETFDLGIDHLGMGWRIVHDFGCALGDYRVSIRSKGAN